MLQVKLFYLFYLAFGRLNDIILKTGALPDVALKVILKFILPGFRYRVLSDSDVIFFELFLDLVIDWEPFSSFAASHFAGSII